MQAFNELSEDLAITVILASPCSLDQLLTTLPSQTHSLAIHATFPSISASARLELDCVTLSTSAATLSLHTCAQNSGIQYLKVENFSLYQGDSQVEADFAAALALAVKSKPSTVHLHGALISPEYLQAMLDALGQSRHLRKLEATNLRTFRPLRSRSGDIAGIHQVLADGLSRLKGLQSLSLQDISFLHRAHRFLPDALKSLTGLTELRLDSCITSPHMIVYFLSSLEKLQSLGISYAVHNEEEASSLAGCISRLTKLTSLTLSGSMASFDLNDYSHSVTSGLVPLVKLKDLHLIGSCVRDRGAAALARAVRGMRQLEALTVGLFRVSEETATLMESLALTCCTKLILLSEVNIRAAAGRLFCAKVGALANLAHLQCPR
ncbi:MAG: hypothetical protein HC767_03465 [Akkermansiaceae bacterium]|nr:hypothetical protein [Akkermansiaceae bacterium]